MGGEVQLALLGLSSAQAGLKGGTLVPLAQTGSRRLSSMAEVPTLAESGFALRPFVLDRAGGAAGDFRHR